MTESITNELRDLLERYETYLSPDSNHRDGYILPKNVVDGAIDGIDRANEKAVNDAYQEGFDANLEVELHDMSDARLSRLGLFRLPVDADGEPWRFGDRCGNGERLSAMHLYANGNGRLDFKGGTKMVIRKGRTTERHRKPTPAERIRDWVERVYGGDDEDSRALLAIADELEGGSDGR